MGAIRVEVRGSRDSERVTSVLGALDRPGVAAAGVAAEVVGELLAGTAPPGAHGLAAWSNAGELLARLGRSASAWPARGLTARSRVPGGQSRSSGPPRPVQHPNITFSSGCQSILHLFQLKTDLLSVEIDHSSDSGFVAEQFGKTLKASGRAPMECASCSQEDRCPHHRPHAPTQRSPSWSRTISSLVNHVVFQVAVHFPRHVDRNELINAGAIGLVEAAQALRRIPRGAVQPLRRTAHPGRDHRCRAVGRLGPTVGSQAGTPARRWPSSSSPVELGRPPSSRDGDRTGHGPEELHALRDRIFRSVVLAFEHVVSDADDDELTLGVDVLGR